jgi:isocitrate lyase
VTMRVVVVQTAKPNIGEATEFAHGVHAARPGKMLAYNLSPSFNWVGARRSCASYESSLRDGVAV